MDRSVVGILLLDDDPFTLRLHTHMLADQGFISVRAFENGHAALAAIEEGPAPDLIFLDLSMPHMDGIEFVRRLVDLAFSGSLVPVSSEDERLRETVERLIRSHGILTPGHLGKPITPDRLRALLDAWERRDARAPIAPPKVYGVKDVARGVRHGEMTNFYQPKVSLKTGAFCGIETLVRWQHPSDGLVAPGLFLSTAEQNGLIEELTRDTFRQALEDATDLRRLGLGVHVAVNLATPILTSVNFPDFALAAVTRACLTPQEIVLEVTEAHLMGDLQASLDVITRLRLMRFTLSIDDFGTGYSSLSRLREIPFEELKIDQRFVHQAGTNPAARAMYDASLGLSRQLGIASVAEGVEDRADWDFVQSTTCGTAQGYFIGRPMPLADLPAWADLWAERVRSGLPLSSEA